MNSHLSDEQLVGYVHHSLTDAQREAMDQHLAICSDCRARLAEHEALQRRIRHSLLADLKSVEPAPAMRFSTIAPHLERPNRLARLGRRFGQVFARATAVAALAGLVVALIVLIEGVERPGVGLRPPAAGALPVVACFLFALPVVNNYYKSRTVPSRLIFSGVLAFILWVGTAILGLYELFLAQDMLFRLYARFWCRHECLGKDYWRALALGRWALIPLSLVWIALVVGGGEYHYRRVGQRSSWKLFGWTVAAQALILVLAFFV
jgi:hypothetical protein